MKIRNVYTIAHIWHWRRGKQRTFIQAHSLRDQLLLLVPHHYCNPSLVIIVHYNNEINILQQNIIFHEIRNLCNSTVAVLG